MEQTPLRLERIDHPACPGQVRNDDLCAFFVTLLQIPHHLLAHLSFLGKSTRQHELGKERIFRPHLSHSFYSKFVVVFPTTTFRENSSFFFGLKRDCTV